MRKHRKLLILVLLLIVALTALWIYREWQAPPRLARVLPEGDRLLYVDLRPLHLWDWNASTPAKLEGDYKQFVDQTGIHFEHDLIEATAVWRETADGRDLESAVVFAARFDPNKLRHYLQGISSRSETYRNRTIYAIPYRGRWVRVSILDETHIALTNMAALEAITGIIDRWERTSAGPELLQEYYRRIPAGSLAWLIDRIPSGSGAAQLPDGLNFSFLENKVAVVSARYTGDLLLRADILTASDADARQVMDSLTMFLSLSRGISGSIGKGGDRDVKAAMDSLHVEQKNNVAVVTATLTNRFLKKVFEEAQPQLLPGTPSPSLEPKPGAR